ncbi:MAG: DUF3341 domain-containing protein, partial [Verrucomicrobiae bacterium]|nr:DUF3341 domain-containing protein [Verrucomicrobiae bacterium]
LGWTGSQRQWHHYEKAYLLLAGLATALVVSVHSIVSLDFAATQLPGWHSTIFPPYFVAGAMFSGFGMVLTLVIPIRRLCGLENIITRRHIDIICKATLATGLIVAYGSVMDAMAGWFGEHEYERYVVLNRIGGPYWWAFWTSVTCACVIPQAFWFSKVRSNLPLVWLISVLINVGMWCERFVIVVGSLHRDFMPANWAYYRPTWVDVCTFAGSFGLFFTFFLLFLRFLPVVAVSELKGHAEDQSVNASANSDSSGSGAPSASTRPTCESTSCGNAARAEYGLLAEFAGATDVLRVADRLRRLGFEHWDAFTPHPVRGLSGAMGLQDSPLGKFAFVGGAVGFVASFVMIWYMNKADYPLPVGGKPLFSPFSAFPTAYELAVLCASVGVFLGIFSLTGLPNLRHPLLRCREFRNATRDRFFVVVESDDPLYDNKRTADLLESLGAKRILTIRQ